MNAGHTPSEDADRQLRRRNLLTGWIVGAVVLGIVAIAMWHFTVSGLPKDRTVLERLEQRGSMPDGAGSAEDANTARTER